MSVKTSQRSPIINYGSYVDTHNASTIFAVLALFIPIIAIYITPDAFWAHDLWPFLPAGAFLFVIVTVALVQLRKGSVVDKKSAEDISSYLSVNYGISVDPKQCAAYCGSWPVPENIILNAEDFQSGERVKISLKFSDDLTSVEPLLAAVPMKSSILSKL